jgi:hypothetical protein
VTLILVAFFFCMIPAGADDIPPNAVRILRRMTKEIQGCPESLVRQKQWGRKANEVERWYYDPPKNVNWNAGKSETPVRSLFSGYIEFSVAYFFQVPDDVKAKYDKDIHLPDPFLGDWNLRYEFDVSADEIVLPRALKRFETSQKWSNLDRNTSFCWDNIPRNSY